MKIVSINLLRLIFETYGNIKTFPFTIEKNKIETILRVISNELYFPSEFQFENDIVQYPEVVSSIMRTFGKS